MKRSQCQAHVVSTNARCTKPAVRGSKYCWWHQSKGLLFVSLLAGAILSLALSEAWHAIVPSVEHQELRSLRQDFAESLKAPDFRLFLNGTEVLDRSVIAIPAGTNPKLEFIVQNSGDLQAINMKVSIKLPVDVLGFRAEGFWTEQQASFISNGKVEILPDKSYILRAKGTFSPGDTFACSPLVIERTISAPESFHLHIRIAANEAEPTYLPVTIMLIPELREQIIIKEEPETVQPWH